MTTQVRDRWVPVAAVLAGMVVALGQPNAASGGQSGAAAEVAAKNQAALKATWQRRYDQALARIASAEARIAASKKTIRKLRQRDRYQGADRTAVETEIASATRDLEAARKQVAEFPDAARRAGIPPGWLREVEERRAREG
ncbi:MAG: hypothetical protein QF570_16150 [Myxococcota bacterium]|jgi:chromosome segregation ATPase|nr:hypothetical protein [Myxococcota bacterium]